MHAVNKRVTLYTRKSLTACQQDVNLYTAKNATVLMQVVDFTGLMQVAKKLYQTCWLHQVASSLWTSTWCNLIFADLLQVDETTCMKPACSSQLAASLLTTCNRLIIIKPEQAMRTHPDIGLVIADLLQLARFWLCTACSQFLTSLEQVVISLWQGWWGQQTRN